MTKWSIWVDDFWSTGLGSISLRPDTHCPFMASENLGFSVHGLGFFGLVVELVGGRRADWAVR